MKYLQILLISLLLSGSLPGQEIALLKDTIQIPFKLVTEKDKNVFTWQSSRQKETRPIVNTGEMKLLQNGDLQIDLDLARLQKWEKAFHYQHKLQLQTQDGRRHTPTKADFEIDNQQLIWHGALEEILEFGREDRLFVITEIWGKKPKGLDEKPTFDIRKKWPHYTGLAVGAGLIVTGQLYKRDSDHSYRQYENTWSQQAEITNDGGKPGKEAAPFYTEAEDQYTLHENLTYAGIAMIGIDAIWYAFRHTRYKKNKKLHDKYGSQPLKDKTVFLQPVYQLSGQPGGITYAGLCLKVAF